MTSWTQALVPDLTGEGFLFEGEQKMTADRSAAPPKSVEESAPSPGLTTSDVETPTLEAPQLVWFDEESIGLGTYFDLERWPVQPIDRHLARTEETIPFRSLRTGSILGGCGFLISIALLALGLELGIVVLFITAGILGISVYGFWMDSGIELINLRLLVSFIIGVFGIALAGLVALLLKS
jgi:hypothetical protein